jgi:hypothetical protein
MIAGSFFLTFGLGAASTALLVKSVASKANVVAEAMRRYIIKSFRSDCDASICICKSNAKDVECSRK